MQMLIVNFDVNLKDVIAKTGGKYLQGKWWFCW
jgi:hypothetical protein